MQMTVFFMDLRALRTTFAIESLAWHLKYRIHSLLALQEIKRPACAQAYK
jgi:hypothetical protein